VWNIKRHRLWLMEGMDSWKHLACFKAISNVPLLIWSRSAEETSLFLINTNLSFERGKRLEFWLSSRKVCHGKDIPRDLQYVSVMSFVWDGSR
jgi:hypothetical protein